MATNRQVGYCKWRAETTFRNDERKLMKGEVLDGMWYPPMNNGYATRVERFTEHKKTLTHTSIIKYEGKVRMETTVYLFKDDAVDFSATFHGELDAKEAETAEQMFKYE